MTACEEYAVYVTALQTVVNLPKAHTAKIESIERRAADEIEALNRRRNEGAQRWTQHRDTSSRLARRINDLAGKVGAPPASLAAPEPTAVAAIPAALDSLRADLERAEQSWQWLVRHRARERTVMASAPQPAAYVAPTAPPTLVAEPPQPPKAGFNQVVLIGVAGAVIVVLVIVIIAMAV